MTGIVNRAYFDRHFPREWKRATRLRHPLAVLVHRGRSLWAINAKHGLAVGDACLRAVAGTVLAAPIADGPS